jgi:hypothetical protein
MVLFAAHVGPGTTNINRGANVELGWKAWPNFFEIAMSARPFFRPQGPRDEHRQAPDCSDWLFQLLSHFEMVLKMRQRGRRPLFQVRVVSLSGIGCPAALQKARRPPISPTARLVIQGVVESSRIAPSLFSGKPDVIVARRMSHLWDAVRPQQTWRTETALRGWACEIRTQKCRGKLSL